MDQLFLYRVLTDIKVELTEEFDRNFQRKAFFDHPWPEVIIPNKRGSLMMRTRNLRLSIRSQIIYHGILFSSSLPYANIQNEGGIIVVTRKMQKYFWAVYYSLINKITYNVKTKTAVYNKQTRSITQEAQYWKFMALKKVGSKITIRPRRFIGNHAQVHVLVKKVVDANFRKLDTEIRNKFTNKGFK